MRNFLYTCIILLSTDAFAQDSTSTKYVDSQNEMATIKKSIAKKSNYAKQIDLLMKTSFERDLFNGNVLVAKDGEIIYQKSLGFTDELKQNSLNRQSVFNIGSIAKEFNAVAIMILVERGSLNLDDKLSRFNMGLPKWSEKVTVRHLINYASGIPPIESGLSPISDDDAWKILRSKENLLFEPGTSYRYDNGNVFLQRRIIEKVSGLSFEEFVMKNIVKPLKMCNAVFDPKPSHKNRTSCYDMENVRCPELKFISGWLWVDINDLYKWVDGMNSNKIISKKSFQTLLENPYAKDEGGSLGRYLEKEELQRHNGVSYKFESIFLNDMKERVIIILLSNNLNQVWDLGYTIHKLMLGKAYEIPKKSIYQAIRTEALENVDRAIQLYYRLKANCGADYSFSNPNELNRLGYELLRLGKNSKSIAIFKLATAEFPNNANLFDSLGEAYYTNKQYDLALKSYNMAISLGEETGSSKKMAEKIKSIN
ncbi:MAG: serine hydrolase [Pedobacter sp.]|nr:MAG: serine hydrolase [Pedobacter sp.]